MKPADKILTDLDSAIRLLDGVQGCAWKIPSRSRFPTGGDPIAARMTGRLEDAVSAAVDALGAACALVALETAEEERITAAAK